MIDRSRDDDAEEKFDAIIQEFRALPKIGLAEAVLHTAGRHLERRRAMVYLRVR